MGRLPRPEALLTVLAPDGLPVARSLLRRGLTGVFGPPPIDAAAHPGDPGLCGPASASWHVIGDHAAIVGGIRALLIQILHPGAMAGVAEHSRYRDDPLGRLQGTSAWVGASTFGALAEVVAAARRVRAVHRPVVGTTPDGQPYAADDPRHLAWVQIALTSSFLATDRAFAARPADASTRDRFVLEQSRLAALLDPRVDLAEVDALASAAGHAPEERAQAVRALLDASPLLADGLLPRDEAGLGAILATYDDDLYVGPQGREAVGFLRRPPLPAVPAAGYRVLFAGAVTTLTSRQRGHLNVHQLVPAAVARARTRTLLASMRAMGGSSPTRRLAAARSLDS